MKCPKCGNENENSAKFCRNCGNALEVKKDKNKNIIIALIAIVIVMFGLVVYASGVLTPQLELESQSFEGFSLDVPVDSKFVLDQSHTTDPDNVFVSYLNKGDTFFDVAWFMVGMNVTEDLCEFDSEFVETDGDLKVYKNESDGMTTYKVVKNGKDANIIVFGSDLNALKRMANTFKDKDFTKLATATTQQVSSSSSSSGEWVSIGSYSGSGTGSESVSVPAGKIKVELSAYPIKNYATNYLYVTSSTGNSGGVDWGSTSAVETRSDSFTFTSSGSEKLDIDYYETVSWNVEIYKYQ